MGESGGDKTAAQRKEAADSVLTSHGYNKSDITFARADKGSLKMSLAIQAGKVSKDADEEGAWNRRIAHAETYNTLEEAIKRRKFLRGVKKILVVSVPLAGPFASSR